MKKAFDPVEITGFRALHDYIVVEDMKFKERLTTSGLFIPSDDGKVQGVRPRWAKVYAVGAEQKDISVGQWVLVEHGRWTRGVNIKDEDGERTIRRIDTDAVMCVSDEEVVDDTMGKPL